MAHTDDAGHLPDEMITSAEITALDRKYAPRWRVFASARREYVCASLRLGVSWVQCDANGRHLPYHEFRMARSAGDLEREIGQVDAALETLLSTGRVFRT